MNGKAIGAIAVLAVTVQLSLVGFGIWVIYKLLVHFGVV